MFLVDGERPVHQRASAPNTVFGAARWRVGALARWRAGALARWRAGLYHQPRT